MSKHHFQDKRISLKAKGLLSEMLSLPESWDYTLAGLASINKESVDAIRTAVWELEKAGYIVRRQGRDEKGKMSAIEYIIYEHPQLPTSMSENPILENPTSDNPITANPSAAHPTAEKPTQLNNKQSNTKELSIDSINHPSIGDTFNFVVAIMYSQLFNLLCDKADDEHGGRLPVHVRCLLDEFANIGQIPKFDKLIATIRSREISASIILQSQSQLKTIYKDAADTIVGNCDVTLFLGGKEKSTLKEISEVLGKETIDTYNTSETRSNTNSYGLNYQKLGKELMSQDEIAVMDGGKCILQLRGVRPFLSDKYDITKHPKYKLLSDYDKRNAFDIEKYQRHHLVLKPNDTVDVYDVGSIG